MRVVQVTGESRGFSGDAEDTEVFMIWSDKRVLITGGTGSFGKKFVEIMLRDFHPAKLIIFSRDELKQFEMRQVFDHSSMRYFIGDVRDRDRLERAMSDVDVVIHAAALKQVPTSEYNPYEAIKTNVLGGQNVIDAAIDNGVKRIIAISTDKAVNPINLYGATKLVAEKIFVQGNSYRGAKDIRFSCVRYGNVIGSRGSVIPLFMRQKETGVITITDKRMSRFWITLDEGVRFVIRCTELMHGGEIFIPKIPSMKLTDLAGAIAPGCTVEEIGIRPGEKVHEVLLSEDEARNAFEIDDMYVIEPLFPWWDSSDRKVGTPLPDGFSYTSNNNTRWIEPGEIMKLIESI